MRKILIILLLIIPLFVNGQYTIGIGTSSDYVPSDEGQTVIDSLSGLQYNEQRVVDEVIRYWKGTGVWDVLDGIWMLGDGGYINWKSPGTFDATVIDTLHTIEWSGVKSNELSGYINLNYNPSTDGVNFTQNDASFGFYILHGYLGGTQRVLGGNDGSNYIDIAPRSSMYLRFNGNVNQYVTTAHSYPVLGLWSFNLTTSTNVEWWIDGDKKDDLTIATSGLPDCDMYGLAWNDNGSPLYYSKHAIGMIYFGGQLTGSQINSLKVGYERLQSHQRRLYTDSQIDIIEHTEGHIPYNCSAYRWGNEVYQVWFQSTSKGDSTRAAMIRKVHDRGDISSSYQVGGSDKGNTDEHVVPYMTIDNNGYIYVAKESGPNHISDIQVFKSDYPLGISEGFTMIDSFDGDYSYPAMLKAGDNIIMVARDNPFNIHVWKKGLGDAQFTDIGTLCNHTEGRNYPYQIKNVTEDTVWITVQIYDSTDPDPGFARTFVLKTVDGTTWMNTQSTFSKDVSVAAISESELNSNFLVASSTLPSSIFCTGGLVDGGFPKLLFEEGSAKTVWTIPGWREVNTMAVYQYSAGWNRTQIRSGLVMHSRHDSYMHNASYLTYNDDEYIIFSYQDKDSTMLEKWTSADFTTWGKDSDFMNGERLKFAWPSNDVQNEKRVGKNILFMGRFDPKQSTNIDDFVIETLKRF